MPGNKAGRNTKDAPDRPDGGMAGKGIDEEEYLLGDGIHPRWSDFPESGHPWPRPDFHPPSPAFLGRSERKNYAWGILESGM
jgi:hypothetical protein